MPIKFPTNGLEAVYFNGVDLSRVVLNGVTVFEKAATGRMMTVGTLYPGAYGDYGYLIWDNIGDMSPNILTTPLGDYLIEHIFWSGAGGDTPMAFASLDPMGNSPSFWANYNLNFHIGGNTINFTGSDYYSGFTYLSYALFALLPKSGTHEIQLELIEI